MPDEQLPSQVITVMEGSKDEADEAAVHAPESNPNTPNRARRSYFVIASSVVAYISSMFLAMKGVGDIAAKVADSMMTFLTVVVPTYILGHSIDRSEVLTRIGERFKKDET